MTDEPTAPQRRCPTCGARNAATAAWCSQCFARFDREPAAVAAADASAADASAADGTTAERAPDAGSVDVAPSEPAHATDDPTADTPPADPVPGDRTDVVGWTCRRCGRRNPVAADRCADCDTSIVEAVVDTEETAPPDLRRVLRAAAVPGGGIVVAGEPLLGWAVGAATAMAVGFALLLAAAGTVAPAIVLTVVGLGLWVVAGVDAVKRVTGRADDVWLRPRVVSVVAGVIVFIAILAVASVTEGGR